MLQEKTRFFLAVARMEITVVARTQVAAAEKGKEVKNTPHDLLL